MVASKNHTQFQTRSHKSYPISDLNGPKTIPFGAVHTYLAYVREYPHSVDCSSRRYLTYFVLCFAVRYSCGFH